MTQLAISMADGGLFLAAIVFLAVLLTFVLDSPSRTNAQEERKVESLDGRER